LNQANWLVNNLKIRSSDFGVWEYNFDFKRYNCKSPWISAMAQGQGISVLVRAYILTGKEKYLKTANKALRAFSISVDEGGVLSYGENDYVFYEEYACPKSSKVLNGFIFSLFGLYDYYIATYDSTAFTLFYEGIESLKNNLCRYDSGDWTYYDCLGLKASLSYHKLHIEQLKALYSITNDEFFMYYAKKWSNYLNSSEN